MKASFREARTAAELAGDKPTWWERPDFAVWSAGRSRLGWALWGHLGSDAAAAMKQIFLATARKLVRPYDMLLDVRPLEVVSKGAFEVIREGALTPKPGLRRYAILVGDAQPGTVQLGLFALAPPSHEWRAFREGGDAGRWLGWPSAVLAAVESRLSERLAEAPMVAAVKRFLAAEVGAARLPDAATTAAAVGASLRALQRALAEADTSFSELLDYARIDRASALLGEPGAKLEAIALAVGFSGAKSLGRLFHRLRGETPADYRKRLAAD